MTSFRYQTPFHVKDNTIYDAADKEVRLWGVNYYAPFNHNFFNLQELGIRHERAIDRDLHDLKLMGVDMIRMHIYEREITDPYGNIVENRNMEVFDYLVDACEKNGIYLMLSPIAWWNTVANNIVQDQQYAYWHTESQKAFGFTNFHSIDAMLWNQDAIDAQVRYLNGLFSRKNRISGKTLNEYKNIVVFELCNEPVYPGFDMTKPEDPNAAITMSNAMYSHGEERKKFVRLWQEFRSQQPPEADDQTCFTKFRAQIMDHYFSTLWPIVAKYFGKNVLNAQFTSYSGILPDGLQEIFDRAPIDVVTIGSYLNCGYGFDAVCTDDMDHLTGARNWFARYAKRAPSKMPVISYEFDSTGSVRGYPIAAIGAKYAQHHVQIANYFTYTPFDTAAWNPGWLVHFLNIAHTPAKTMGMVIGGEIFRKFGPEMKLEEQPDRWTGDGFEILRNGDVILLKTDDFFGYSADNDLELSDPASLRRVAGIGKSGFAESNGNGCYFLEKLSENQWKLVLMPCHRMLCDPTRGRVYRGMANRYVNCQKEPPVSQLIYDRIRFRLNAFALIACTDDAGNSVAVADNSIHVMPGEYLLTIAPC